jgi:hypothetical protein
MGWRDDIKHLAITALVFLTFFVLALCVAMANQSGWFEFSEQTSASLYTESEFVLVVKDNGETVYKAATGVSEALRQELLTTVYPNPTAAEDAATEQPSGPWWDDYLTTRPAEAHAVNVCWNGDNPKVSLQTGGGRHITKHRYDYNGWRYTRTDHQTLTQYGYVTYDVFKYRVDKRYC